MAVALFSGQALSIAPFQDIRLRDWVKSQLASGTYDHVIIFSAAMVPYLLESKWPKDRVVFDMVDIDSDKWEQYSRASTGPLVKLYSRKPILCANWNAPRPAPLGELA